MNKYLEINNIYIYFSLLLLTLNVPFHIMYPGLGTPDLLWRMNQRDLGGIRNRTVTTKSSIGGFYVYAGGTWHWNFGKNSTDL